MVAGHGGGCFTLSCVAAPTDRVRTNFLLTLVAAGILDEALTRRVFMLAAVVPGQLGAVSSSSSSASEVVVVPPFPSFDSFARMAGVGQLFEKAWGIGSSSSSSSSSSSFLDATMARVASDAAASSVSAAAATGQQSSEDHDSSPSIKKPKC